MTHDHRRARAAGPLRVRSRDHGAGGHRHAARLSRTGRLRSALGNDVSLLQSAVEPLQRVLARRARDRDAGHPHARGRSARHGRLPPAKFARGEFIGTDSPKGRILIRGEYGDDIVDDARVGGSARSSSTTRQGLVLRHRPRACPAQPGHQALIVTGVTTEVCVHTTVREANDRGFECLVLEDCCGSYFPVPRGRAADHLRRGRDLRLGRDLERSSSPPSDQRRSLSHGPRLLDPR